MTFATTLDDIQKEVKNNEKYIQQILEQQIKEIAFVNGALHKGKLIFEQWRGMGWPGSRTHTVHIADITQGSSVQLVDLDYGKIRECKLAEDEPYDKFTEMFRWEAIDGPEEHTNKSLRMPSDSPKYNAIKKKISDCFNPEIGSELVFVNGDLHTGRVIFDRYKGIGWLSGRTHSIEFTDPSVPREAAHVYTIDINFGRIRKCTPMMRTPPFDKENYWKAIDDPETLLAISKQ